MAKFRLDSIGSLARQMEFAPRAKRLSQVAAAERLLAEIEPARGYPLEFVVFRITGFKSKPAGVSDELLTGLALQHDLGLLIEKIGDTLDLRVDEFEEPILSIDDVAARFEVTSKTIQRWRRKGLAARRFVFGDGKRRVGFLLSSVERFVGAQSSGQATSSNSATLSDAARDAMIRAAARLAEGSGSQRDLTCRLARRFDRSPLTVLHTIRKFDTEHPDDAILPRLASDMTRAEQQRVVQLVRRGVSLRKLSRRFGRPRSTLYQAVMDARAERLLARKVRFIDDPLYQQADAGRLLDDMTRGGELSVDADAEPVRIPRGLPPYLASLYRVPLLTPAQERSLFLKFNYHKYQFAMLRRRLDPELARRRDIAALEGALRDMHRVKNQITQANLRLVVSVARKHLQPGLNLMELVSEGNLTLMRAVESFDVHRNVRFSTYVTLSLMKGFARSVPQMRTATRAHFLDDRAGELPDARGDDVVSLIAHRDELAALLDRLEPREQTILRMHYGLDADDGPATFQEVGERLGLSKHRVRQIEAEALIKLRATLGEPAASPERN